MGQILFYLKTFHYRIETFNDIMSNFHVMKKKRKEKEKRKVYNNDDFSED